MVNELIILFRNQHFPHICIFQLYISSVLVKTAASQAQKDSYSPKPRKIKSIFVMSQTLQFISGATAYCEMFSAARHTVLSHSLGLQGMDAGTHLCHI